MNDNDTRKLLEVLNRLADEVGDLAGFVDDLVDQVHLLATAGAPSPSDINDEARRHVQTKGS